MLRASTDPSFGEFLGNVDKEIQRVEEEIRGTVAGIVELERSILAAKQDNNDQEVQQLREEKSQLREEKRQLREEKRQLMDERLLRMDRTQGVGSRSSVPGSIHMLGLQGDEGRASAGHRLGWNSIFEPTQVVNEVMLEIRPEEEEEEGEEEKAVLSKAEEEVSA